MYELQDSDVHAEAKRVLSGNTSDDDVVIIKDLVKVGQSWTVASWNICSTCTPRSTQLT